VGGGAAVGELQPTPLTTKRVGARARITLAGYGIEKVVTSPDRVRYSR
jgi:hypothetical protein